MSQHGHQENFFELKVGGWGEESIVPGWRQQIQIDKILMEPQKSPYQEIAAYESQKLGRIMIIDGRIQLTTADEFTYHEMFVHIPFMAHGNVKKALIIGGGDGATLRETVKHKNVEVTLVDIDEKIIEASKLHFPSLHEGAWDNPRAKIIVGDGIKFAEETKEKFDVVIIDSTDPEEDGPSGALYRTPFYESCKRCMTEGGIIVTQNGHPQFETYPKISLSHLAKAFKHATMYQFNVPTYMGGLQGFAYATDNGDTLSVSVEELEKRWEATGITNVKHYTPEYHKSVFVLPKWLKEQVAESLALAHPK